MNRKELKELNKYIRSLTIEEHEYYNIMEMVVNVLDSYDNKLLNKAELKITKEIKSDTESTGQ